MIIRVHPIHGSRKMIDGLGSANDRAKKRPLWKGPSQFDPSNLFSLEAISICLQPFNAIVALVKFSLLSSVDF